MINLIPKSLKLKSSLLVVPGPPLHLRESEREIFLFEGHVESWLVDFFKLLDGRNLESLRKELKNVSEEKISSTIDKIFEAGLLEGEKSIAPEIKVSFAISSSLTVKIQEFLPIASSTEPDLVVAHQEFMKPSALKELNQECFILNRPLLLVSLQNSWGRLGPFMIPKETACLECYRSRLMRNRLNVNAYEAFEKLNIAWPQSSNPENESILAGLAAKEIRRWSEQKSMSNISGRVLYMNLDTFEFNFETLLKVPYCKICDAKTSW